MNSERPSWDDYFTKIVKVTSERSPCHRLHVGCLLVKDNRIVSQGYNGFLPGCKHTSIVRDNHEQAVVHAEQNAIGYAARNGIDTEGCIIYCTMTPCISCAKLVSAAGIKEFYYLTEYRLDDGLRFLEYCVIKAWKIDTLYLIN